MTFAKSVHRTLWGSESWEISAHRSDPSVIADGESAGRTLRDIAPEFPLLFKVIDARTRLSVQVHPNEETCGLTGGDPKSEMWCALSDGPIYAGLKPGSSPADIEEAVRSGRFEELLVRHEAKFGDVFYIPGGLVHAIGDGVRLYEVQQSSDTTFRLYDWGRVGDDGRPRRLHVKEALKAIDYSLPVPEPREALETPYFRFSRLIVRGKTDLSAGTDEYLAVFAARGDVIVGGRPVREGTSILLPPSTGDAFAAEDSVLFLTRFAR